MLHFSLIFKPNFYIKIKFYLDSIYFNFYEQYYSIAN
uniref:Uncharacterized protein n=1 Tax=virus sp. ctE0n6 TaxID=2827985 RepID=A0A8S5RF65_9VIRU|nr:MAG TPA: hypothetical protein [virus sp. ctE0n6]